MRFAIIGSDASVLQLVQAVVDDPRHECIAAFDIGKQQTELERLTGLPTQLDSWEGLLSGSVADAVIVSSRTNDRAAFERRVDQLRKLVQLPLPMILVHPASEAIIAFELEMIRRDTGCIMLPYHPFVWNPLIEDVRHVMSEDEASVVGKIEQISMRRTMHDRGRDEVLDQFACDAYLLRHLLGDITQLGAMGNSAGDTSYANLGVQMSGSANVIARWSIGPVETKPTAQLTVHGSRGTIVLECPLDEQSWKLRVNAPEPTEQCNTESKSAKFALEEFTRAAGGKGNPSRWESASRALELSEAVEQSCRRGRTIPLYNEELSEEGTFKSLMAASGCGLLMVGLVVLFVVAVVEGLQLPIREFTIWRLWPFYLLTPFAIFLLLQLLKLVFIEPQKSASEPRP